MIVIPNVILQMLDDDEREYMEELYRQYHRLMLSVAWKYARDGFAIEDIVSTSCVSMMKNIPTMRRLEKPQLQAYIAQVVRNSALNYAAKLKVIEKHVVLDDEEHGESASDEAVEEKIVLRDELDMVWKAISRLSEKEQQIMRMKYAQEMSDADIAEAVGLSANSMPEKLSRAARAMQRGICRLPVNIVRFPERSEKIALSCFLIVAEI